MVETVLFPHKFRVVFLCIWVFLLNICMYHMFVCCLLRSEERALESLELWGCWNGSLVLCKSMKPLYPLSHLSSPPWSLLDRIYVLCLFLRNELCSWLLHNAESTDWHWVSSAIALHRNFWGKVSYRLGQQASWIPLQCVCLCAQHFHSARIPAQPLHLCDNMLIFNKDTSSNECVHAAF